MHPLNSKIIPHFPSEHTPRDTQITILTEIEKAIENKKKFIIIQAPTGCGKSHIAATLSRFSNDPDPTFVDLVKSYEIFKKRGGDAGGYLHEEVLKNLPRFGCATLTVTKALQNQYSNLFEEIKILKGKTNYQCAVDDDFDCEVAPCTLSRKILNNCIETHNCPYINARADSISDKFASFNYAVYLCMPKHIRYRQFIVCDEASELEDELVKFYSCEIDYKAISLNEIGVSKLLVDDRTQANAWLTDYTMGLGRIVKELIDDIENDRKDKIDTRKLVLKLKSYKNLFDKLVVILQNWYKSEYIVELSKDGCTFTPLYVNMLSQEFFSQAEHVILMSGTIIDPATFARTLGIDSYHYVDIESDFDSEKSPIYISKTHKLNYKNQEKLIPEIALRASQICEHHKDDKGIVHTHTFKITEAMQRIVGGNPRFLFRDDKMTNEMLLKEHYDTNDKTVLISPSLGFGTDLKDDFGRFQIIMKTPYLPLGSKRIKILADRNPKWYEMKALVILVQMCGRTTRSKDDHSETYILDAQVIDLVQRNKNKLPRYFLKRIH